MKKRIISVICLILCLSFSVSAFIGCARKDEKSEDTSSKSKNTENESTTGYPDGLGDIDMGKATVKFLTRVEEVAKNEITEEENIHEVINDAVHTRNLNVQDRLNCVIDNTDQIVGDMDDAAANKLKTLFKAGAGEYDVYAANSFNSVMSAYNGYLVNLKNCNNLHLENQYWSQGFNQEVSIGDAQYLCTGPFSMAFYRYMFVTLFNKDIFTKHSTEYPYAAVRNYEWTLEYMTTLAQNFYKDTNVTDDSGLFGFVISVGEFTCMTDGFWTSCGLSVASKDEDNYYKLDIDVAKFDDAIGKILGLTDSDGCLKLDTDDGTMFKKFTDEEAAMVCLRLISVEDEKFRSMGTYGIVPMPMLNSLQKAYYTHEQDQFIVYGIPGYIKEDERIQRVGTFLEAFAAESYRTVTPAYYEIALTSKYANDEDSVEMLNTIAKSAHFDASSIYIKLFGFNTTNFRTFIAKSTASVSAKLKAAETSISKSVEKVNKAYRNLEG